MPCLWYLKMEVVDDNFGRGIFKVLTQGPVLGNDFFLQIG